MTRQTSKASESGNVLFLILIAVALFAALSYVVTQSTRSGGGSTEREKNVLSSAQMTQYPTALRTAIIRMVLAGAGIENIKFNAPASFGPSTNLEVFNINGGGATYQDAPAELMNGGASAGTWRFNANFDVPEIGSDGVGGNDVIAFLPNVSAGVCKQVNEELGVVLGACAHTVDPAIPDAVTAVTNAAIKQQMITGYTFPTTNQVDLQCNGGTAFTRQASGCFRDVAGAEYVFYSVLLER